MLKSKDLIKEIDMVRIRNFGIFLIFFGFILYAASLKNMSGWFIAFGFISVFFWYIVENRKG